jgi:redox-sensitive bicupin YhaK (pirin superfamily)
MNDDFVQPDRGFGTHGHANMEIVTYVVNGKLTHEDSMGASESLGRGSVQFMTAGRGVRHSEFNLEKDKSLRFIQTWIVPRRNGLKPNYGSFDPMTKSAAESKVCSSRNQWRHLVSDVQDESTSTPVEIEQDANLHVAEMEKGQSLTLNIGKNRMAYVLCVEGAVKIRTGISEISLNRHDGCEITRTSALDESVDLLFEAIGSETVEDGSELAAHVLVFEMQYVPGAGRKDF